MQPGGIKPRKCTEREKVGAVKGGTGKKKALVLHFVQVWPFSIGQGNS
jgi:hypothetical protein